VVCQLEALQKCRNLYELKKTLRNLPTTLYETYDRILQDIDEIHRESALKLLQFLTFSVEKVSLSQAVEVLATDPDAKNGSLFDPERRYNPSDVLALCLGLVAMTIPNTETSYPGHIVNDEGKSEPQITLAHFSVREYLVSESLRIHSKLSFYHCDEKLANTSIAKTCVAYLLQFEQRIGRDIHMSHRFRSYAAEHWIQHTRPNNDDDGILRQLILNLLHPEVYLKWLVLCPWNTDYNKWAPIYCMADFGLAIVCRDLLQNGADIYVQGGPYGNPLLIASSSGHDSTVRLLLENGADINAQGPYGNALRAASIGGHDDIVQLLLEKGADIKAPEGVFGSPLQLASSGGHRAIVQLLLENGADVNEKDGMYGNALQAALAKGYHSIVQLLREKGADNNAQGGYHGNAFHAAMGNSTADSDSWPVDWISE
jgi:hypothetical protein